MAKSFSYLTKQSGNIHKISHNVLHNRFVLYFIFLVAIGNLFLFVFSNDIMSVGIFFTTGLLTSFFSKNMVVIMVTAMVVANIIRLGSRHGRDGFKKGGIDDEDDDEGFKDDEDDDEEKKKEGFKKKTAKGEEDADDDDKDE